MPRLAHHLRPLTFSWLLAIVVAVQLTAAAPAPGAPPERLTPVVASVVAPPQPVEAGDGRTRSRPATAAPISPTSCC